MRDSILYWLKVHEDEILVLLWTAALLFLVRSSGMILNNYAETAFLKRYGIEYLPIVNMLNTVFTFLITGIMATFMARMTGARILFYLFIFSGLSVTVIRLIIPMGLELVYPVLFMLKSQFELLQAMLFWTLANDLFNTRQSKRLFPLLTAGGVIGLIIGSFGTPYMSKTFHFDNLLFVYLATTLAGSVLVWGMGRQFPSLLRQKKKGSAKAGRTSMLEEIKRAWPILRQSALFKIVLVLTFMPNVVIPIMNYQFNFTVDQYFPTESGMLAFFSYFRGSLNVVNLIILLFVGRLYGYFGLPIALMLHPLNYALAFMAFFLRFDVFSAIYARMSTNILRTTINMPANGILIGLFPESYRAMIRPFLRGTVVRAGLLLGSALILLSVNIFHPRYLSLVALPFVLAWIAAPMILKSKYAAILRDLISRNMLDIRSLEAENPGLLFHQDSASQELTQAFLNAQGDDAVWYARLLKSLNVENLDMLILQALPKQDQATRLKLIELLSHKPSQEALRILQGLLDPGSPSLNVQILKIVKSADPGHLQIDSIQAFLHDEHPEVRAYAAACLYVHDPAAIRQTLETWLASKDMHECKSGIIAAGETGQGEAYGQQLASMLQDTEYETVFPEILQALAKLGSPDLQDLALSLWDHPRADIRHAALLVLEITDPETLKRAVKHLGDPDQDVRELAKQKIKQASYTNGQILIESLSLPNRYLRENIFDLLEFLEIKDIDQHRFTTENLQECYTSLAKAAALENIPEGKNKQLLFDHLLQKKELILENILRILALHEKDNRMRTVRRGLFSKDSRVRGNSIELLGDILDRRLFNMFQPLLEGFSLSRTVASGHKFFKLPSLNPEEGQLFPALLQSTDWIEVVLALSTLEDLANTGQQSIIYGQQNIIAQLCSSAIQPVQQAALLLNSKIDMADAKETIMENQLTVSDKILLLRNIAIFADLNISELGAIATVTEEEEYPEQKTIIQEGEPGETVFLIIQGQVGVYKQGDQGQEMQLDTMGKGDYFGEMALFEEMERSATIRSLEPSRFLVLHKQEFNELVREYPRIALQICTALSHRLRKLQSRLAQSQ